MRAQRDVLSEASLFDTIAGEGGAMHAMTFLSVATAFLPASAAVYYFCRSISLALSAFLFLLGSLLAVTFVVGMGMADFWIVYPPWVTWRGWLLPLGLWSASLTLFFLSPQQPERFDQDQPPLK
jgi:hypothetical protein